jgi:hypothetical protein
MPQLVFREAVRLDPYQPIGNPHGAVRSKSDTEWSASGVLLEVYGLVGIATQKYIHAVIRKTRNPDIARAVGNHTLRTQRTP